MLKGEIIVQTGPSLSQRVAYQTVREKVQMQLDSAAKHPGFVELFVFLVGVGVVDNSYFDVLQHLASAYASSKHRQLPFSAFTVANKLPETIQSEDTCVDDF